MQAQFQDQKVHNEEDFRIDLSKFDTAMSTTTPDYKLQGTKREAPGTSADGKRARMEDNVALKGGVRQPQQKYNLLVCLPCLPGGYSALK